MVNLIKALVKFQQEVPSIPKNKLNPFFSKGGQKAMYADLAQVVSVCMGPLNSNGLAISQKMCIDSSGRNVLTTVLLHVSGESDQSSIYLPAIDDPQKLTAAITYLRRTQYVSILGLVADDDDDGNAVGEQGKQQQPPQNRPTFALETSRASAPAQSQEAMAKPSPRPSNTSVLSDDRPATQKQIDYLKRMGVKFDPAITIKQAGEMISGLNNAY